MASYAARLADNPHKGRVGAPELRETARTLRKKMELLYALVEEIDVQAYFQVRVVGTRQVYA